MAEIVDVLSHEIATYIVGAIGAVLSVLAGMALDALRKRLGEDRTEILRGRLSEAIDRITDALNRQGVTRDAIEDRVATYVAATLSETLQKLGATPDTLARRVKAQVTAKLGPAGAP